MKTHPVFSVLLPMTGLHLIECKIALVVGAAKPAFYHVTGGTV